MKPTGLEFDAVLMVLVFVDDMTASLKTYHDEDVDDAKACNPTAIESSCVATHLNQTTKGLLTAKSAAVTERGDDHRQCREDAKQCYVDMEASCPDYNNYRKHYSPYQDRIHSPLESYQDSTLPDCVKTSPDDAAFSDTSIKTDLEEQLAAMELCLKITKAWLDPLFDRYKNCRSSARTCRDMLAKCKTKQNNFENAHCEWQETQDLKCFGVNDCGSEDTDHCQGVCERIELRERYRNADNETGQRLVCLLNVIFGEPVDFRDTATEWYAPPANKTAALAACKEEDQSQPDPIQCNPGSWVPPNPCADVIHSTCSDNFNTQSYTNVGLTLSTSCEQGNDVDGCSLESQARFKSVDPCQVSDLGSCSA